MKIDQSHLENLHTDTRKVLGESQEDRVNHLYGDRFIMYPLAKQIIAEVEELMNRPKKSRMECRLIIGASNNGKTSIIRKLERLHPPTDGIEEDALPIVSVLAPTTPDISALYDRILNYILIPFKKNDPLTKKEMEIKYHFGNLGVKILVIDEIHNILSGSVSRQKAFMNAIKNLNNDLRISIVLVGIKDALNATSTDDQIKSRFRPILLPRWKLDRDFISLLASVEKTLPLKRASNLAGDREMAETILDLSEGLIGEMAAIINNMAAKAIKTGKEKLTAEDIKKSGYIKPSQSRGLRVLEA